MQDERTDKTTTFLIQGQGCFFGKDTQGLGQNSFWTCVCVGVDRLCLNCVLEVETTNHCIARVVYHMHLIGRFTLQSLVYQQSHKRMRLLKTKYRIISSCQSHKNKTQRNSTLEAHNTIPKKYIYIHLDIILSCVMTELKFCDDQKKN